ncbi:hypothetical protein P4C99_16005 [Pontiellaceae bacterium B1224]|nr:hypothetical protein [Pontiellaceae bacterium B1224]
MGFLKSLLEPPRNKIWANVARDIGGEYIDRSFLGPKAVVFHHREWKIQLDCFVGANTYSRNTYTRMRAPFMSKNKLLFKIHRNVEIINAGNMIDLQDIHIEDPLFDEQFVIMGNQTPTIRHLLASPTLKQLLNKQRAIHFEIRDDEAIFLNKFPAGVDQLYFQLAEDILNEQRLKDLFELFSATLDHLVKIDAAFESAPSTSTTKANSNT